MIDLKIIFSYFVFGFIAAIIYEFILALKKCSSKFFFAHILIDLTFFYFLVCYAFVKMSYFVSNTSIFYVLVFAGTGFLLEKMSLHFLIDKGFQFVYTKISRVIKKLTQSKLGGKIFK